MGCGAGGVRGRSLVSSGRRTRASWDWVRRAAPYGGRRSDGLTSKARGEMERLRRENEQLRKERGITEASGGLVREGE